MITLSNSLERAEMSLEELRVSELQSGLRSALRRLEEALSQDEDPEMALVMVEALVESL